MGKANMGKMTRSMAMAHKRKPLHLKGVGVGGDAEITSHLNAHEGLSEAGTHADLPVADKARVTLVNVDDSFGVNVETDEDASQEVASCGSQGSHHVHDG